MWACMHLTVIDKQVHWYMVHTHTTHQNANPKIDAHRNSKHFCSGQICNFIFFNTKNDKIFLRVKNISESKKNSIHFT